MAVYCYHRGWNRPGMEFLKRKLEGYRGDIREELARSAWGYWAHSLSKSGTDRKRAAKHLHDLYRSSKALQSDTEPWSLPRKILLADLDRTIASPPARSTGFEADIDALLEVEFDGTRGFSYGGPEEFDKLAPPLKSLWMAGFDAVPALIAHVDDRRLARGVMTGMNKYPSHQTRVGEVCTTLLESLAGEEALPWTGFRDGLELGDRATAEKWWEQAKSLGEEEYLAANILPKKTEKTWPNSYNAAILARKYPHRLPAIYETLLDRYPKTQKWPLAELLMMAEVPREVKVLLFVRMASSGDGDQRIPGLRHLVTLRYPGVLDMILQRLETLSGKPVVAYWLDEAPTLVSMIAQFDDPRGWEALKRFAQRADPGMRLQIIRAFGRGTTEADQLKRHMQFLSRFLADNTLVDFSEGSGFSGPHADFDLPKITVRDSALRHISLCLGMKEYPRREWTPEDWAHWRPRVLAALKAFLAKPQPAPSRR